MKKATFAALAALLALGGCSLGTSTGSDHNSARGCTDIAGGAAPEDRCAQDDSRVATDRDPGYKYRFTKKCGKANRFSNLSKWQPQHWQPPSGSTIVVCTRESNTKKMLARHMKRMENATGVKKCTDVTSYDYNWQNDMLCTRRDGSTFYTDYQGAALYLGYEGVADMRG